MDALLLERLRQTNPWLFGKGSVGETSVARPPDPWLERRQVDVTSLRGSRRAHLIVGPRQAGKSSLVWSLLREMARPLFLNLEEPVFRGWCRSPAAFVADLSELGAPVDAIFMDEVQWLGEATLFLKGVVDLRPGMPMIVTGSASFHLRSRSRESMAGRATRHLLLPFALDEVVPTDPGASRASLRMQRRDAITRMMQIGGYPEVWLAQDPRGVLGDLLQAFVLRDASDLFAVDRIDAYQTLLQLCARQVGNLVNLAEFASVCGVAAGTVSRYLSLMEEAYVLRLLPSFSGGKRREVTSARKVYFLDSGLRNALVHPRETRPALAADRGAVVENWVFTELAKGLPWDQPIRYWRSLSGAEVDFILDSPGRLLGIEVKAAALSRPRLTRSSRSFISAYQPSEFWVLNDSLETREMLDATTVRWIRFEELCGALAGWREGRRLSSR